MLDVSPVGCKSSAKYSSVTHNLTIFDWAENLVTFFQSLGNANVTNLRLR